MNDQVIPPLPAGFTLDGAQQSVPALPPGFTLDAQPTPTLWDSIVADQQDTTVLGRAGRDLAGGYHDARAALAQNSQMGDLAQSVLNTSAINAPPVMPGQTVTDQGQHLSQIFDDLILDPSDPASATWQDRVAADNVALRDDMIERAPEIAAHQAAAAQYPQRPVIDAISNSGNIGDALQAFIQDPVGAIAGATLRSAPQVAPGLAVGVVNPVAGAATLGATSGLIESGGTSADTLAQQGIDIATAEGVDQALQNEAATLDAATRGDKAGAIVGTVDAATAGLAGGSLIPDKLVTGPIKREVANMAAQTAVQAGAGGGAEAAKQLALDGVISQPGAIFLEVVGEAGGAPIEVAGFGQKRLRDAFSSWAQSRGRNPAEVTNAELQAAAAEGDQAAAEILRGVGVTDEQMASMSPEFRAAAAQRAESRQAADATRAPVQNDTGSTQEFGRFERELDRQRAEQAGVEAGDINPAAVTPPAQRQPLPETMAVNADGQANAANAGSGLEAGQTLRSEGELKSTALVPVEPQDRRAPMSDDEAARARRQMGAGQANTAPDVGTMQAPENRAPQTRDDVAMQREAAGAFSSADAQRGRVAADVRDTQPAARPQGADAQPVYLDEGVPVLVIGREWATVGGKQVEVARVQRYDPRTGQPEADAEPYLVPTRDLRRSNYAADPRQAQDFIERAQGPRNPEQPRMAGDPVSREPDQTYRATQPDANEQFPGAGDGRSPMPEQPAGQGPWRERSTREEDYIRDFQARQNGEQARSRNDYQGKEWSGTFSNKAKDADPDGRFTVDDAGHVASSKGGPVRFGDQKQAAKWILNVGHKSSPDQVFEIANHPSGSGFTVRETGRNEGPKDGGPKNDGPRPGARREGAAEAPRALPAPPQAAMDLEQEGDTGPQSLGAAATPRFKRPSTLLARIRAWGGINSKALGGDWGDLLRQFPGVIDNRKRMFGMKGGGLMTDEIGRRMLEDGYMVGMDNDGTKVDTQKVEALLSEMARGEPVYSPADQSQLADWEAQQLADEGVSEEVANRKELNALSNEILGRELTEQEIERVRARMFGGDYAVRTDEAETRAAFTDAMEWEIMESAYADAKEAGGLDDLPFDFPSEENEKGTSTDANGPANRQRAGDPEAPKSAGGNAQAADAAPSRSSGDQEAQDYEILTSNEVEAIEWYLKNQAHRDSSVARTLRAIIERGRTDGSATDEDVLTSVLGVHHNATKSKPASTERTAQGEQSVIPGAERSAKQAQESRDSGSGRLKGDVPQKAADEGLFGEPRSLRDLFSDESGTLNLTALGDALKRAGYGIQRAILEGPLARLIDSVIDVGLVVSIAKAIKGGAITSSMRSADGRSLIHQLIQWSYMSSDGRMRSIARRIKSAALDRVINQIATTGGNIGSDGMPYEAELKQRAQKRSREVQEILASIMEDPKLSKEEKAQMLAAVVRQVQNPRSINKETRIGKVALAVQKFLKDELAYMRDAGVEVGEIKDGYYPREIDREAVIANQQKFLEAATKLYMDDPATRMSRDDARIAAAAWLANILSESPGTPHQAANSSSTPRFTAGRVFGKLLEQRLGDFLLSDPDIALTSYSYRAAKAAAVARRFGDRFSKWSEIEREIIDQGGTAVLPELRDYVATVVGLNNSRAGLNGLIRNGSSLLRTWTTLMLLEKAAIASLSEPFLAAARTGNAWDGLHAAVLTIKDMFRKRKGSKSEMRELAEDIGAIAGSMSHAIMSARFTGEDVAGRAQQFILAQYFSRTGLETLTNSSIVAQTKIGSIFMRRLAHDISKGGATAKSSRIYMRELGIPDADIDGLSKAIVALGNELPTLDNMPGKQGDAVRNALFRFQTEVIQQPTRASRPTWANHPVGAIVFQLGSWSYSFSRNILGRGARMAIRGMTEKDLAAVDRARLMMAIVPGMAMTYAASYGLGELRDLWEEEVSELWSPDGKSTRRELTDGAKLERAASRAGFFGVLDPLVQLWSGARYGRDASSALLGPGLGQLTGAVNDAAAYFTRNSERTNTAERKIAGKYYDLLIEPTLNVLLSAARANPVSGALTIGVIPGLREAFVSEAAGEPSAKDLKRARKDKVTGIIEGMFGGQ